MKGQAKVLILCILLLLSLFPTTLIKLVSSQSDLFQIWLIVPGENTSRKAYAQIIEANLDSVGIDARRVELDWNTVYDRALAPNITTLGKTYLQGGFDSLFVGYSPAINPDPLPFYDSSQFPPIGMNYYLWNNSESDRLGRLIGETNDEATRLQYTKDWQRLAYNEQPSATFYYTQEIVAYDPTALQGEPFTAYHFPVWPGVEKWKLNSSTTQTNIVLAQAWPAPGEGLNPLLTTSYYDLTVWGEVFDGLTQRNDTVGKQVLPDLATDWSVAADQKTWTVHLRQGVTWHDGVKFNATDVKFTYDLLMNDALASTGFFAKQIIGSPDNVKIVGEYTVEFDLPKPYAYFVSSIMDRTGYGAIVPYHVLRDMPLSLWRTHPFNTGSAAYTVNTGNGSYTAYGPIGTGPYVYMGYDASTSSNQLTKNNNYWNRVALENAGVFGIRNYYVQWIEDSTPAIAALKSGDIDVLDSQYGLTSKTADIQSPWGALASYDALGVQELGFNMQHPVFGTGVDTPFGKQDPSRAAEAARYVRQAISHLIPRQQIIDTVLGGYATLGITTPITRATIGFDSSLQPYSYDVTLAKALLAAAGYNTGVPAIPEFSLTIMLSVLITSSVLVAISGRILKRKIPTI